MMKTILNGGVAIGEAIVLNPAANGDDNLAHTTAFVTANNGGYGPNFVSSGADQVNNHTRLLALLAPGKIVRPYTIMSPTVDMRTFEQAVQMWTWAQFGCGRAVADLVHGGVIPKEVAEGLLISLQVFIHPKANSGEAIFQTQYEATYRSVEAAMTNSQTVDFMLQNRTSAIHPLCTVGEGESAAVISADAVQNLIDAVHTKS